MNFGELRARLDDLAGLDLDDDERDGLLNEGHRELAVRGEWYRDETEIGPTVADQASYTLPTDIYRILNVEVDGYDLPSASANDIARLTRGSSALLYVNGVWRVSYSANVRKLTIYPTPGEAGQTIIVTAIERPALMDDDADEPVVPPEYHNAIVDYAASIAFGAVEDNPDLRQFYEDKFERKVMDLRALTYSQDGRSMTYWGNTVQG